MKQRTKILIKNVDGVVKLVKHGNSITIVTMLEAALAQCLVEYKWKMSL